VRSRGGRTRDAHSRHLERYSDGDDQEEWRRYLKAIAVPLGDRRTRLERQKGSPDLAIGRQGFLAGRTRPDDA